MIAGCGYIICRPEKTQPPSGKVMPDAICLSGLRSTHFCRPDKTQPRSGEVMPDALCLSGLRSAHFCRPDKAQLPSDEVMPDALRLSGLRSAYFCRLGTPSNHMLNNAVVLRYSASAITSAASGRSSHKTSKTLTTCSGRLGCP